jgi:hypothetical protein
MKIIDRITYKKTFLMNIALMLTSLMACVFFFLFYISFVEVNPLSKLLNVFLLLVSILNATTLYKNNKGGLCKIALLLNSILAVAAFSIVSKLISTGDVHALTPTIFLLLPALINIRMIYKLTK